MASEPARARLLWAILPLVLPVTFWHNAVCRSPALSFSSAINMAMKRFAPCSAVVRHSPSLWAAVIHWSALIPNALRLPRRHPVRSLFCSPTQPAPLTNSPNIMYFGSRVSSMRATHPANRTRLLGIITSRSMLSFTS